MKGKRKFYRNVTKEAYIIKDSVDFDKTEFMSSQTTVT